MNITHCPFCQNKKLYLLQNDYIKCSSCHKKFSIKKLNTDYRVIELFCSNISANKCAKILGLNYRTIQSRYMLFRKIIALYLEELHYSMPIDNSSYEEFYYFTNNQKKDKKKSLYNAINIIGFYTNKKIFTLLMPKLPLYDNIEDTKTFEQYLKWHKIHSINAYSTPISIFWKYLEENLKKYKGVNEKNFFYYLKECEFKFNFLHNKQIEILKKLCY